MIYKPWLQLYRKSGKRSKWKIDCDALSDEDIETLAYLIKQMTGYFTSVEGIPTGGIRLAEVLKKHVSEEFDLKSCHLIVDDVLTSGRSMEEAKAGRHDSATVKGRNLCQRQVPRMDKAFVFPKWRLCMSVLVDWQIRSRLKLLSGDPQKLTLTPFSDYGQCPKEAISYGLTTSGYDLRVGNLFLIFTNTSACVVDPKDFKKSNFQELRAETGQAILIPPNCFALADTLEYIQMPRDVVGEVKGKSRLARGGYIMASTPIEASWRGFITLEIGNLSPLPMKVYAGEGIGQLVFYKLDAEPEKDYDQKPHKRFQNQLGLTGPHGVEVEAEEAKNA